MTQNNQKTLVNEQYLKQESERIAKEKEENSKYVKLNDGENKIELDLSVLPVTDTKGKYGTKYIWTTTTKKLNPKLGYQVALLISASETLHSLFIKAISAGHNPFTLIKLGEGINTRYAIKELNQEGNI